MSDQNESVSASEQHRRGKNKELPSYAKPSIAARLPSYQNANAEAIKAAFMPNTYVSIQSLGRGPADAFSEKPSFRTGHTENGAFSEFVYVCSPYELSEQSASSQREKNEERMSQIGDGRPFFAGYSCFQAKFESHAVEYLSEPYDLRAEHERQEAWLRESKAIAGPFRPPGVEHALERPTRALLGDVMTSLFRSLCEDWPEAQPVVLSTAEDLITIYFRCDRIKSSSGLMAYMNNALRRNDAITHYDLRKVPEGWGVQTKDNHYLYTLRPSWVRPRAFAVPSSAEGGKRMTPQEPPSEQK